MYAMDIVEYYFEVATLEILSLALKEEKKCKKDKGRRNLFSHTRGNLKIPQIKSLSQ